MRCFCNSQGFVTLQSFVYACIHIYRCMYVCMYACMLVCMFIYACMHTDSSIRAHTCMEHIGQKFADTLVTAEYLHIYIYVCILYIYI